MARVTMWVPIIGDGGKEHGPFRADIPRDKMKHSCPADIPLRLTPGHVLRGHPLNRLCRIRPDAEDAPLITTAVDQGMVPYHDALIVELCVGRTQEERESLLLDKVRRGMSKKFALEIEEEIRRPERPNGTDRDGCG